MDQPLPRLNVEQVGQVIGRAAELLGDILHAEIGIGELLTDETLGLEDLADIAIELTGAGLHQVAQQTKERKQQTLSHGIARRPLPNRRTCLQLAWFALFGAVLNQIFFVEGLSRTTPAHSAIINSLIPVLTLSGAILLRRERATVGRVVAIAVAFASVLVLLRVESFRSDNRSLSLEPVGTCGQPVQPGAIARPGQRFEATYDFQQEQVVAFVSQFDVETGAVKCGPAEEKIRTYEIEPAHVPVKSA